MNESSPSSYPVSFDVEHQLTERNRLTSFFRIILAIPHLILVGGPSGIGVVGIPLFIFAQDDGSFNNFGGGGSAGVIGLVVSIMAIITWFWVVITASMPRGLWDFMNFYMKWRVNSVAYVALLRDEYPPFGTGAYPVQFSAGDFPEERNRLTVFFRLFLLIPHFIVLFFLGIAWFITAFIGWLAILFTGSYPEGLYTFAIGYLRWSLRVEAYGFLMRDEYPPFSLE